MKILYISHLSTNIAAGMNWSVPASIKAQEQIDDVLWVNTTDVFMPHWKNTKAYRNLKSLGEKLCLDILPDFFHYPDVVVFEGLYFKEYLGFAKELQKKDIPYIIVPRSSMTLKAMHNHAWLKKWVAHKIFFNSFIRNAWKIQYLTQQEAADSIKLFNTPYFVVSNGITIPSSKKTHFSKNGIHAVFVGRLDIYQKGLDLLLNAVNQNANILRKENFTLSIYGPQKYDYQKISEDIINRKLSDFVSLCGEVSGKQKEEVLLASDLFIMTSRFEGHPMGLIEALSYGVPVLVTPGTNMADVIRKYDAGWVCEENENSISLVLNEICVERSKLENKSKNGLILSTRYNWDVLAREFHDEINTL